MEFICRIFGQLAVVVMVLYLFFVVLVAAAKAAEPTRPAFCDVVVPMARIMEYEINKIPASDRHGKIYWRLKNNQRILRKQLKALCGVNLSRWPYDD